ncbi:DUF4270 domain-containing protein [Chryseobacterium sp. L7]|uniref:DUF4270 domain-containing protein n=1 Tax=Chryseobacterium endalhagicum TaxID=2797638 RepID=A0ABS1QKV1_9FLAO|nr:DUF4270 family protein [Chryseobacterium endalhagicum]MBL1223253.1 DUF4270 domain-containing protein [Chryseobacterium endalhagicum]
MTHTVKRTLAMLFVAVFGSTLLYNCEPELDSLGEQLFLDGAAEGNVTSYDLIAYNVNNNDSIRSDAGRLVSQVSTTGSSLSLAVLGAFNEPQFGMQKASYLTQLRMSTDNFDFGKTPKVDSVVLVMKPYISSAADSIVTRPLKDENILIGTENVAVSTDIKTYPTDFSFKYGKTKLGSGGSHSLMHINVDEITTFLDGNSDAFRYSNASVSTGESLGSGILEGRVTAKTITKKSDNSTVFTSEPGLRIRLKNDFFQTKILDKNGKPELMDAANFTRYFKGIRLSVTDTDGYLLQMAPDNMEIIMYYTNEKDTNGTITRPQSTFKLLLTGSLGNARLGQYEYNRIGSAWNTAKDMINTTTGDPKLYLQGMGGPSVRVKIPDETITELKKQYNEKKAAIVSAKIRIYTDAASWSNKYKKIADNFTLLFLTETATGSGVFTPKEFLADTSVGFTWLRSYDLDKNPSYYEFTVTKTVKDIVEPAEDGTTKTNKLLLLNIGKFVMSDTAPLGYRYTKRAFETERGVYVGSDKTNPKRIQLRVIYGTKQ